MKRYMVLFLAICMVFGFVGGAIAEELEAQIVYTNPTQTYDKTINGTKWLVEFVKNVDACQQANEFPCAQDWDFVPSRYCKNYDPSEPFFSDQRCGWFNCMCCEVPGHQGVIGRRDGRTCGDDNYSAFSLVFDTDLDWQSCRTDWDSNYLDKFSWADFVTKVTIEPGCEYIDNECVARTTVEEERFFNEGMWNDYFDTAPYPYCLDCDVEVLYCSYEDTVCVEDGCDGGCDVCTAVQEGCDGDDCDEEIICSWFHPDLEFTRANDGATNPTFSEVVYGGRKLKVHDKSCPQCFKDYFRAGEASFMTRYKWYDWDVTTCDECEGEGDVVLWNTKPPKCGCDEPHDCKPDPECYPICEESPIFQFVRFFRMDLYNCDNITGIDLDFPVCCPCDADAEWGIWKFVEVDECAEYCAWEPMDVTFNQDCDTPLCGDEECDCTLSLSLAGDCGTDECNPGELCSLEDETFVLGWFVPSMVDRVIDTTEISVKAYPCDPTTLVMADVEEMEVPEGASEDGIYFEMVFDPANADGICKVKLCIEPLQGDFGLFTFDEDTGYWVAASQDDEGCFVFQGDLKALLGVTLGAGDPADFPTAAPTPDPTPDPDPTPTPAPSTASSDNGGGGCNAGFSAGLLLFLVPLGLAWFKRF